MSRKNTPKSFWLRVKRGHKDACWEWQGARTSAGYGNLTWQGIHVQAHRVAYFLTHSHIKLQTGFRDKGKAASYRRFVLHVCDNKACCNPRHLILGSMSTNQKDAYAKGRKTQPQGAAHTNAKLSTAAVKSIRLCYAKGNVRQVDLAAQYGVSQRAISLVVRGETYRDA